MENLHKATSFRRSVRREDRYVQISGFVGTTRKTFEIDCLNPKYHKNIRYFKDTSGKTEGYMLDCYIVIVNVQFSCLPNGQNGITCRTT